MARWRREAASARALLDELERSLSSPLLREAVLDQLAEALRRLGDDLSRGADPSRDRRG